MLTKRAQLNKRTITGSATNSPIPNSLIKELGLKPIKPLPYGNSYSAWAWQGEIAQPDKAIKIIIKALPDYDYRGKNKWQRETKYYLSHKEKFEINPPFYEAIITKTGKILKLEVIVPSEQRKALSQREYTVGEAKVRGYNEGSMHFREARGPSKESVEKAFDHYLEGMGTSRAKENNKGGGAIRGTSARQVGTHWLKSWNHFRSDI